MGEQIKAHSFSGILFSDKKVLYEDVNETKEANMKWLHIASFQLYDILEK